MDVLRLSALAMLEPRCRRIIVTGVEFLQALMLDAAGIEEAHMTVSQAKSNDSQPPAPHGGATLRALRRAAGRTQLWVEAEAELGTGYLQRVESGKVAQPGRELVERILTALGARYSERRLILDLYGYASLAPLPDRADFAWAREATARDLDATPFPSYVLDCAHRLVAWNRHVARLFGIMPSDTSLGGLAGRSIMAAWCDPASTLPALVAEPEQFYVALIRAMHFEMRRFGSEPWYAEVLADLQSLPLFHAHWEIVERQSPPVSSERSIAPLRLRVSGAGILTFRLTSEPLTRDDRFRVIGFIPADAAALNWCAAVSTTASCGNREL